MKLFLPVLLALQVATPATKPTLTTSDRVALADLERTKSEAQKTYNDANQQELTIEREWMAAHPGWTINPVTFAIESVDTGKGEPAKK